MSATKTIMPELERVDGQAARPEPAPKREFRNEPAPRLKVIGEPPVVGPDDGGRAGDWFDRLARAFGAETADVGNQFLFELGKVLRDHDPEARASTLNAVLAAARGLMPRDEVDGQMAVQLGMLHNAAVTSFAGASYPGHPDVVKLFDRKDQLTGAALTLAGVRCVRAYALHLETYERMRTRRPRRRDAS